MSETAENPVPLGPPELCFDCRAFTKDHFSVDEFLQEHRNRAKLETMRDDLGVYLKLLRSAMIDLINKDYGDFVDLSSNLTGLDKAIARIQAPLGQLREELLQVRQSIDGAMQEISVQLSVRHELRERKRSLRSLCRVQASLKKIKSVLAATDDDAPSRRRQWLERAAAEFSQLDYHVRRCPKDMSVEDSRDFEDIGKMLTISVDKLFLESLSKGDDGKPELFQCLSLYHTLDKVALAEHSYRRVVVAPAMERLITESNLKAFPLGLTSMFQKIVEFLDRDMRLLIEATDEFNKRSGSRFNFFLNSFWVDIEEKLETNLTSIFAAGDPDSFFKRYSETLKFLEDLGQRRQPRDLDEFYKHPSFINFMDKWNLPVYFLLRFQEMAKNVENAFIDTSGGGAAGEWKLPASRALWENLLRCWSNDVFMLPIAHKFWKFSLQLMSRYLGWCKTVTKGKTDIQSLVHLHWDVTHLLEKIPEFEAVALAKLPKLSEPTVLSLKNSLEESKTELSQQLNEIGQEIVRTLSSDLAASLRQVNDIPRLYRRTNREPPTRPCPYVSSLLDPVTKFHESNRNHPNVQRWLQSVFGNVTKRYYASVDDVLNSVQKTEESLRRLKKARDRSSAMAPANDRRVDDDNKIRHQLLLDVHAFAEGIEKLGLTSASVDQLRDLLLLVEASQKT